MANFRLGFISLKFGKPCSVRLNDELGFTRKGLNMKRLVFITLENDTIGDGVFFPEVARTLSEAAAHIAGQRICNSECSTFMSSGGTKVVIMGAALTEEYIQPQDQRAPQQQGRF